MISQALFNSIRPAVSGSVGAIAASTVSTSPVSIGLGAGAGLLIDSFVRSTSQKQSAAVPSVPSRLLFLDPPSGPVPGIPAMPKPDGLVQESVISAQDAAMDAAMMAGATAVGQALIPVPFVGAAVGFGLGALAVGFGRALRGRN
jgi:hypothetical protein